MSGRSFHSLFMVASCAGAALGCYLVSLRVASERAALEDVETQIVLAQRDLRVLQTEIGTRGRLAQLERWNVKVLALSAPSADQFLQGSFELARLARPHQGRFRGAGGAGLGARASPHGRRSERPPMIPACLPALHGKRAPAQASLKTETREVPVKPVAAMPQPTGGKSMERPVTAARPVEKKSVDKPGLAAAKDPGG